MKPSRELRVLSATNDVTFNVDLVRAYQKAVAEVHVGTAGLLIGHCDFDIVHFHWPEELVGWSVPPDEDTCDAVLAAVDRASRNAFLVCSVHNIIPHSTNLGDAITRNYYSRFYSKMDAIGHFSRTSFIEMQKSYPELEPSHHFIHGMNLFHSLQCHPMSKREARDLLKISHNETWVATFGQIRSFDELNLIHRAFDILGGDAPNLLFASRLPYSFGSRKQIVRRHLHSRWLRKHNVRVMEGYLPDRLTAAIFQGADGIIIPRSGTHLNSGLLPLAATFATPLIAPQYGIYDEFLTGTANPTYRPADPASLAEALREVCSLDIKKVSEINKTMASTWGAGNIVSCIIQKYTEHHLRV